jgi:hypothetical protein
MRSALNSDFRLISTASDCLFLSAVRRHGSTRRVSRPSLPIKMRHFLKI